MVKDAMANVQDVIQNVFTQDDHGDSLSPRIFPDTEYLISLHAPFLLENLLPVEALFQLVRKKTHTTDGALLWTGKIGAGKARPIHTVSLDASVILTVSLSYMEKEAGVVVHLTKEDEGNTYDAASILLAATGGHKETFSNGPKGSIDMTDSVGQKMRLMVENTDVGSGQKHIVVYATHWIVNISNHSLVLKDSNHSTLPSGTYNPVTGLDGTSVVGDYFSYNMDMVYPGKPGAVHAVLEHSNLGECTSDLPFDTIKVLFMLSCVAF